MAEPVEFRPSSAGLALAVIAFPALSAVLVLLGVVAVLELSPNVGATLFVIGLVLALVPALLLALTLRGWFTLEVDDDALTVVGLFGANPLRLRWVDLDAVGLVGMRGSRLLAVRPLEPWKRSPRWALRWDREQQLLTIAGVDNWSAPRDELLASLRQFAGPYWTEYLDESDRSRPTST